MKLSHRSCRGPVVARPRSGISLIEVVVACTLLAVTLTALTGLAARMAARTRSIGVVEQRTATYFQEVNRVESMPYDSLSTGRYLVTDSVKSGNSYYVWAYAVGAEVYNANPTGTSMYRDITLTVTPRVTGANAVTGVIRRVRAPASNALNFP
jgi:Tfp pilus assembly protein PilV